MSGDEHGGKQMAAFLLKKGDYLCELAKTHERGNEHEKAKELYMQAAGYYKKGGAIDKAKEAVAKANEAAAKAAEVEPSNE
jgi:hypothetical protein